MSFAAYSLAGESQGWAGVLVDACFKLRISFSLKEALFFVFLKLETWKKALFILINFFSLAATKAVATRRAFRLPFRRDQWTVLRLTTPR